jgi:hypothetical protein
MLRGVGLVRTASIIMVTRIGELGTTLAVTNNRRTLRSNFVFLRGVCQLLVTANVVPSTPILVTLMMEAILFPRNVGSYWSHSA